MQGTDLHVADIRGGMAAFQTLADGDIDMTPKGEND